MSKIAQFMKTLYDYEYEEPTVEEEYIEDEEDLYEEDPYEEPTPYIQEQPMISQIQSTATVVMLSPYDIRSSQMVCDHIRAGHIVICNLTPNGNNQRVVDYISGGIYTLQGKIEPTAIKTTFVCTPYNVELITDTNEVEAKVSAL